MPATPPAPGAQLPALTGARWWAAAVVFVLHALVFLPVYPFQKSELFRALHAVVPMQQGAAGVTFFFVLSGFVICWSFRRGMSVRGYYLRRLLKIYPTHVISALVLVLVVAAPLARPVVWLPNLLLVHTWVPKWTTLGGLNVPSWSLCAELLFYLSFPLALPLVARIPRSRLWPAAAGLLVLIMVLHTGLHLWVDGPKGTANVFAARLLPGDVSPEFEIHVSPEWFAQSDIPIPASYWLGYPFPASRLPEFYVGVLAARMVAEGVWRNTRLSTPLAALVLAYGATWFVPIDYKMSALLVGPTAAVVATLAARDLAGISGINASRPLVWLGDISFAFYMIQFPVMVLVTRLFIGGRRWSAGGWAMWAGVSFIASIIAAAAIYHGVDKPLMNRFAKRPPRDNRYAAPRAHSPIKALTKR
ncbi:acyltransferase family protein [Nocardia bhagyanarayanae]|uniref:Peptidoglycan/LPS O-acetylase OafA/YrhL n=1 Tax=Nocardia bhagyanarayanae TaxID=1215925 RepID=A0A543FIG7_9NOCA|nr:acyltransferase [Nocardia bhagyanarayanae]TQM33649.1 peptidoglycan/LPS O-acetylase OafA/YrhL [Nocardia bhagyanarayanae]